MFFKPFHHQVKQSRVRRRLTQEVLAQRCGISRTRLVQLESNYRNPTPKERLALARKLGLYETAPLSIGVKGRLRSQGRRSRTSAPIYFPPQDRPTEVRYRAALSHYPHYVETVVKQLEIRSDFVDLAYLCSKLACDSRAEVLLILAILQRGALPALMSLSELGWLRHKAIDPRSRTEVNHRPQPCLVLDETVFFFQVALLTPRLYVVDTLVWKQGWYVLEIDGKGHDFSNDDERSQQLALPVLRFRTEEILRARFLDTVLGQLGSSRARSTNDTLPDF